MRKQFNYNKIIIYVIIFIIFIFTINAEVEVIPVVMGLWYSSHAKQLTKLINLKETQGCYLFKVDSYNSATYLYFRCTKTLDGANKDDKKSSEKLTL